MSALIEAFRAAGRAVSAVFTRLAEVFTEARRVAGALFARLSAALPVGVESRAASARRRRLDRSLRVLQRRAARRARRAARHAARWSQAEARALRRLPDAPFVDHDRPHPVGSVCDAACVALLGDAGPEAAIPLRAGGRR